MADQARRIRSLLAKAESTTFPAEVPSSDARPTS
jgi:hypothetical protein